MRTSPRQNLFGAAMACLLIAGVLTPVVVLAQRDTSTQTQGQLFTLISVAEASKAYAATAVNYASAHDLAVSSFQAQLGQADSLLATAQADAQSNSNISAGIQSVQAAMRDYTEVATTVTVALSDAGLTFNVQYAAAAGAIAEVNATASVVASVAARSCTASGVEVSNSSAFSKACADIEAQVSAATLHLRQAVLVLAQTSGQGGANVNLAQVLSLIAAARSEVAASQSDLVTVASYTYSQRGQKYYTSVMVPLEAKANATLRAEQSALATLDQLQTATSDYVTSESSATTGIDSSASALATAIAQVNTGQVSTSISSAESTAGQVSADLSSLSTLAGLPSSVLNDISACVTASNMYSQSLGTTETLSSSYNQTQVAQFSAYLGSMDSQKSYLQTLGVTYNSTYNRVLLDLQGLLGLPGVLNYYNELSNLQVSSTVAGVDTSLAQETSAMADVQADIASLTSVISSSSSSILAATSFMNNLAGVSSQITAVLNATAAAALAQAAASAQATVQSAESFVVSANATTTATIGGFALAATSLTGASVTLGGQAQATANAVVTAAALVASDTTTRAAEIASGQAGISQALQLFSSLDVAGGASAMAQASLELQAAAEASA